MVQAARCVEGLNVDRGLLLIGGVQEQYGELLRISAKVFAEGIQKMRAQYTSDLPAFAIEVHGMKGALYNIGAEEMGDLAKKLEFAAKGGDAACCREVYPAFESRLDVLARELEEATRVESGPAGTGNIPELIKALLRIQEACRKYDAILAGKILSSFIGLSWDLASLGPAVAAIGEALENIDYDEAEVRIVSLLTILEGPDREAES
jgi:HPt (histidine-containing phosphotransfer) domain-containing protein